MSVLSQFGAIAKDFESGSAWHRRIGNQRSRISRKIWTGSVVIAINVLKTFQKGHIFLADEITLRSF